MLEAGKALKVSIYLNEGSTHHGAASEASILDYLFFRGVAGATVLKGVAGFGADHHLHTASTVELSDRLPVKIEFIETREKVDALLGKLTELAGTGMIEIQETTVVKPPVAKAPAQIPHRTVSGKAKLLRIYIEEGDRWEGRPLHQALVEALRANHMAGVTVLKAMQGWSFDRALQDGAAPAHTATLMLSVIDCEDRIAGFLPVLERMVGRGMAVLSDVDVVQYRSGSAAPGTGAGEGTGYGEEGI